MRSNQRNSTITLGSWISKGKTSISTLHDEHASSLYVIAAFSLEKPKEWIVSHPNYVLTNTEKKVMDVRLARLIAGEPLPYITGKQNFFGHEFNVNPNVLIPRPETELMVEEAISELRHFEEPIQIAEVGTGSGCIAISLAKALPNAHITATDISFTALETAKQNLVLHHVNKQVHLIQGNLLQCVSEKFHLICANLPYISSKILQELQVRKYEPVQALDGGKDGLFYIKELLSNINDYLLTKGAILIEIDQLQEASIQKFCKKHFPFGSCTIMRDLAKLPRLAAIRLDS